MAQILAGGRAVPPLRAAQGRVLMAVLGEGRLGAQDCRESLPSASPAIRSVRILLKHKEASPPSGWSGGCPAWPLGSLPLGSCPGLGSPSVHPMRARNQEATHPWPRSLPPASPPPAPGAPAPAPLVHPGGRLASAGQAMEGSSCDRLQTGTTRMIQEVQLSNLRSCQGPECLGEVQPGGPGRRPGACCKNSRPPGLAQDPQGLFPAVDTRHYGDAPWAPGPPAPSSSRVPSARDGGVTTKTV